MQILRVCVTDEALLVEILEANKSLVQVEIREVESVASSSVDDAVEGGNTENLTTIKNKYKIYFI